MARSGRAFGKQAVTIMPGPGTPKDKHDPQLSCFLRTLVNCWYAGGEAIKRGEVGQASDESKSGQSLFGSLAYW